MSTNQPAAAGADLERMPFASLLDAIIPALFANDAAFAKKLGVNQSQVHRWRRDVKPQITMLVRISEATGITVETLARIVGYEPDRKGE
ncbi:MAG TPA: CII family transcriptional regulator [Streptosporangiaceae bacterium]|nr:CII family transcriptional regulator [Streptosporangiaceae bacterium]